MEVGTFKKEMQWHVYYHNEKKYFLKNINMVKFIIFYPNLNESFKINLHHCDFCGLLILKCMFDDQANA